MDALNRLISYFLDIASEIIKKGSVSNSCDQNSFETNIQHLTYEIFRALGSLIYQNGSIINEKNLHTLLGIKNQSKGILLVILDKIEKQEQETNDAVNKLKLILTQLIFNLTMPVRILNPAMGTLTIGNTDINNPLSYTTSFIDDKYKATCVYILIRMIRLQNLSIDSGQNASVKINIDEQTKEYDSRLIIKALQSLENLFSSIELQKTQPISIVHLDWLQSPINEYQLGDILAIVKVQ